MSAGHGLSRREFLGYSAGVTATPLLMTAASPGPVHGQPARELFPIGCYTRPWDKHDYRVALDAIVEAGFQYAGLMTAQVKGGLVVSASTPPEEARRIGEEAKSRGLKVLSVYGGGIGVDRSLNDGIADLRRLIDNCHACGSANLLMGGVSNESLYDVYYKAIAECCDYAQNQGVHISLKPHGGLNATGPQCRRTVERVNHPNFRLWYDAGNIFYYSDGMLNPVDDVETVAGLVTGLCVKDYRHPKDVLVTPGAGRVEFPVVFALLRQGGFDRGPLVIECLAPGDLKHSLDQARQARRFLEELIAQDDHTVLEQFAETLQAGIGVMDITPPIGYRMSGYFRERLSTGTANPLEAKALVLRQGRVRTALVCCDIIGIAPQVSEQARRLAAQRTMIPASNIVIAATHSHTGPLYWGALRDHFHTKAVAEHGDDPCEPFDYAQQLVDHIVRAIGEANQAAAPANITAGTAEQHGLSFNRRFHMKDSSVRFNPGVLNPDIVKPAGPIDPQVGIVMLRRPGAERPFAAVVNFALHLDTIGGTLYAADYPYFLQEELRKAYGQDFTPLFATGTCGDINHIDVTQRERLRTETIGRTLGQTVLAAADRLKPVNAPDLAARQEVVRAPLQRFDPDQVAWARENINKVGTQELSFLEQVRAYKILAVQARRSETLGLEVQVFRLASDLAIVALPGEVFVDLGLAIKKASPFATTLIIELCNDAPGYIPTEKAFAEGSYETVNSRVAPGGGEAMAETAIRLLRDLAPTGRAAQ